MITPLFPISKNTIVSMNFWGFTPNFFQHAENLFNSFLEANTENLKAEFLYSIYS